MKDLERAFELEYFLRILTITFSLLPLNEKKLRNVHIRHTFCFSLEREIGPTFFLRGRLSERYKSMIPSHLGKKGEPPSSKIGVIILGFPK